MQDQVTRKFKSLLKESADTPKAKMSSEQRCEKASAARKINKDRQRQLAEVNRIPDDPGECRAGQ